jgi:hypothetical protein
MGTGLRITVGTIVLTILMTTSLSAGAEEYVACWTEMVTDSLTLRQTPVTRCRLAGGEIVDYASDTSIPVTLSPAAGTDLSGDCWYLTSLATNWVYLSLFLDGDAILGWDPDPATPGGVAFATGRIPRCTSEPNPDVDPTSDVWEYVIAYVHPPPRPELSPAVGEGVTGLETFVGVDVPKDHTATLAAGGSSLEVFIEVTAIVVDWGDGSTISFPAGVSDLSGYPDGVATHIYEVKSAEGYTIEVSYDWTARWRVPGGVWVFLSVPNTTTSVSYPVSEIVSIITG